MEKTNLSTSALVKSKRGSRVVFTQPVLNTCETLAGQAGTCASHSLLADVQQQLSGARLIRWGSGTDELTAEKLKSVSVSKIWAAVDRNVDMVIQQCEEALGNAQMHTFKAMGNPVATLARSILESHRLMTVEWSQMRSVEMSESDFQQYREFLSCSVNLHTETSKLLAEAKSDNLLRSDPFAKSAAETAAFIFGTLITSGKIEKTRAIKFVALLADYVQFCMSMEATPASIRFAWDRVRDSIGNLPVDMPARELPLMFPRRLLQKSRLDDTNKTVEYLRATDEADAMHIADDYERLAAQFRYAPFLLESVASANSTLENALNEVYSTAQSTLLASADLVRALYRKQMITLGDDEGNAEALAELTENDFLYDDEDLTERDLEIDFEEIQKFAHAPQTSKQKDVYFVHNPLFCEVCFRSAGSRKYCSEHTNTGGKNRQEIKQAELFLPEYRKALFALLSAFRESKITDNPRLTAGSLPPLPYLGSIEALQDQTPLLLDKLLNCASKIVEAETSESAAERQRLVTAVADIRLKVQHAATTKPAVWSATVCAVADLVNLNQESEDLYGLVDLLLEYAKGRVDPKLLLGHELRSFAAAYTSDILLRISAICSGPSINSIALLPDDIRRDFYTQWFEGYQSLFALGDQIILEAHDLGYLGMPRHRSAYSMGSLWDHFSRLAAWRVAENLPPLQKQRMRRLSYETVNALLIKGKGIEDIARELETTPDGVRAAVERWSKRIKQS